MPTVDRILKERPLLHHRDNNQPRRSELSATTGDSDSSQLHTTPPRRRTILDEVMSQKALIILDDAVADARFNRAGSILAQGICSAMSVPLIHRGEVLGVMHLESLAQTSAFGEKDRDLFTTIASQAALAIKAATLRENVEAAGRERLTRDAKEHARMERLFRNLPSGVLLLDADKRLVYANPEAEEILPLFTKAKKGEILDYLGLHAVHDIPERSGSSGMLDLVVPGVRRRVFIVSAARSSHDGAGRETVIVLRETTSEREREQTAARGERMALVGQLAGGIAHDFNNLLSVILNYSEFLAAELKGTQLEEDIDLIRQAGQRAGALTRQLLAFSRREIVMPMVLDLNRVVSGLEMLLRRTLGEDLELVIEVAPGLRNVKADPGRIEQVLMNLAVNARDAMEAGGKLTIATVNADFESVEAMAGGDELSPGSYVALVVSDKGEGMSPDTVRRIFEPFFTTKEVGKGTGLGLATVHGIVLQAGGGIRVESVVGEGTTFSVYLPATDENAAAAERAARPGSQPPVPNGKRVLVTEDENGVRRLTVRILRAAGFDVVEAASGVEALRLAKERGPIDLLLTDVVMPRMSGQDLALKLREETRQLPVLFVSGYSDAADRCQVIANGATILQKPFTPRELIDRVHEALRDAVTSPLPEHP